MKYTLFSQLVNIVFYIMVNLILFLFFHRFVFLDFLLFGLRFYLVCCIGSVSFLFFLMCLSCRVQYQVLFLEIGYSLRTFLVINRSGQGRSRCLFPLLFPSECLLLLVFDFFLILLLDFVNLFVFFLDSLLFLIVFHPQFFNLFQVLSAFDEDGKNTYCLLIFFSDFYQFHQYFDCRSQA